MQKTSGVVGLFGLLVIGCIDPTQSTETNESLLASDDTEELLSAPAKEDPADLPPTTQATCTAQCGSAQPVSCTSSPTCGGAWDQDCAAGEQGHVTCNGVSYYCAPCPCREGQVRYRSGPGCCCNYDDPDAPQAREILVMEVCRNGAWVFQGTSCDGNNCGGICPV